MTKWSGASALSPPRTPGDTFDVEPTGARVVVHEMMFNRVRDGRVATTWAMTAGPGFYEQITGRQAPEAVDNLG